MSRAKISLDMLPPPFNQINSKEDFDRIQCRFNLRGDYDTPNNDPIEALEQFKIAIDETIAELKEKEKKHEQN